MKAKKEATRAGSFPKFALHKNLAVKPKKRWQVMCGDMKHWRVGFYCPAEAKPADVKALEKHTCVELFMLVSGKMTLLIDDGKGEREVALKLNEPMMVSGWHCGFCPQGKHTGTALVVERDHFSTVYRER